MCVIAAVDKEGKRPSQGQVDAMWQKNPDGGGIAWLDGKKVVFQKGLNLGEIQDLIKAVPKPFVAHFRISTCGGVTKRLTHPFLVQEDCPLILKGATSSPVLFHNGVWGNWERKMEDICIRTGWKLPTGIWSDSRAMAWIASHIGLGFLEFVAQGSGQRIVSLDPVEGINLYGDWKFREHDKFWVSNESWLGALKKKEDKGGTSSNPPQAGGPTTTPSASPNPMSETVDLRTSMRNTGATGSGTAAMGPACQIIGGPKDSSVCDSESKSEGSQPESPFVLQAGLSNSEKLQQLEAIWTTTVDHRCRHRITRERFDALKRMYQRRKKTLEMMLRVEAAEAAAQERIEKSSTHNLVH